jgi:Type VI secretion system (T6SS), amidase immunity protein
MMRRFAQVCLAALAGCAPTSATMPGAAPRLPETASRTYAENYKDMMLAGCIAMAYRDVPAVTDDARHTASALNEWTEYDAERATGVNVQIIDRYLARTYHAKERPDIQLNLLKCIDMYHSKELEAQVSTYVDRPTASYADDAPKQD